MKKVILATESARHFGLETTSVETGRYPSGELFVILKGSVRDKDVSIIGSTESPAENIIEPLLLLQDVTDGGAGKVRIIFPYFGYSRADRESKKGEAIGAKAVALSIGAVGGKNLEIILIDPHSSLVKTYFDSPVTELSFTDRLAEKFTGTENLSVAAPDDGAVNRAEKFANALGIKNIIKAEKERISVNEVRIKNVTGRVGERVVIVDDMIETGETILEVAKKLESLGAKEIYVAVTHIIYSADGWKKLAESPLIKRVVASDTIKPPANLSPKFEIISIKTLLEKELFS